MRDWDTRISELKKNIEAARNRFVIPFLDSKYLEKQAVKEMEAAGFTLKENISNLPWQHCMVFVKK